MNKPYLFPLLLSLVLAIPCTACAGKQTEAKTAVHEKKAVAAPSSGQALEDIVAGLADFEQRASKYKKEEWNFVLGYAHARQGNWKESYEMLGRAYEEVPALRDHILYYRALAANQLKLGKEAEELLNELNRDYPDSVWATESRIERGRALMLQSRFTEAKHELEAVRKLVDNERAFDVDLLIIRTKIEDGDALAPSLIRGLILSAGSEGKLAEVQSLIDDAQKRFNTDIRGWLGEPAQQLKLAESFAARSQWDEAAARLEKLVGRNHLDPAMEAEAKWLLARSYRSIHRYDEAISLMEELSKNPNAHGFSESLLQTLATTYTKKNDYAKAIALRERMMGEASPGSAAHSVMAYKIAFLYMDEGKYDEAISRWNQALAAKLGGEQRRNAQWYLAWCHYMSKDYNEALQDINAMLKAGKKSEIHDRLLYWKGRVLEKMGEKVAARDSYSQVISDHPDGYYAELAHRRIKGEKKDVGSFAMVEAKGRAESALQADVNFGDGGSGHFGRAVIFDRLSLHDEAARELRAAGLAGGGDELSRELILASRNFAHDAAYSTVAARYRDALKGSPSDGGLSRVIWESAYPRAYDPLVSRLVRDSSVDPRVIWSIMRNESTFRPEVVSPAGAVGLMQLMPATANRLARESGSGTVDRRALYRPAENIAWGVAYMKKLSNLFPNNPVAWIASYNAGEEAVARWIKNGRLDDIEEWIEEIPYDETNLYVKKVLVSYWNYQRLYGN